MQLVAGLASSSSAQEESEAGAVAPLTNLQDKSSHVDVSAPETSARSDTGASPNDPSEVAATTGTAHESPSAEQSAPDASFDSPSSGGDPLPASYLGFFWAMGTNELAFGCQMLEEKHRLLEWSKGGRAWHRADWTWMVDRCCCGRKLYES